MRILVAEDERVLADLVGEGLRKHAMAVDVVYDGAAASERLAVHDYDVLVLDRDLLRVHGDVICRELTKAGARTRILMLTAAAAVSERVAGLGLGADDYLPSTTPSWWHGCEPWGSPGAPQPASPATGA